MLLHLLHNFSRMYIVHINKTKVCPSAIKVQSILHPGTSLFSMIRNIRNYFRITVSAQQYSLYSIVYCILGWSDFAFLWNFEKKQVGVVAFVKKNMFSLKKFFY